MDPDFYEEDEDPAAIHAAFERGEKGVTAQPWYPNAWTYDVLTGRMGPMLTNGGGRV